MQRLVLVSTGAKREVWCSTGGPSNSIYALDIEKRAIIKGWPAHDKKIFGLCQVDNEVWSGGLDLCIKVWAADVCSLPLSPVDQLLTRQPELRAAEDDQAKESHFLPRRRRGQRLGRHRRRGEDLLQERTLHLRSCDDSFLVQHKEKKAAPIAVPISALCYIPSKQVVWAGTLRNILVLDTQKGTQKMILEGHTDIIHSLLRVGTEIWSASSDKTIRVWSEDGDLLQSLIGHTSRVFDLAALGIEFVWSVSWDKSIFVWHAQVRSARSVRRHSCGNSARRTTST